MADTGIRGKGSSPGEAFEMGATALTAVIAEPSKVSVQAAIHVSCRAGNLEYLFFDWINALIYEMEIRKMLFSSFNVAILSGAELSELEAEVFGEYLDREKHRPAVIVKGATLTELIVKEDRGEWVAQCVVDV